ncbi:unnamed protein product [Rotaria socialis]|uniref:Protein quiver n=1 Tax=Rotaria socialis TaxID=392032 RepID=A0A817TGW9_9BILA|nr:unnamed protein product [Rotaria socialis]CAF3361110.1 unnamed protein product [Rotaria socialis]
MKYIIALLLVIQCIGFVSTYQCYSCNSVSTLACGDPFNANSIPSTEIVEAGPNEVCEKSNVGGIITRSLATTITCIGGVNGCKKASPLGIDVVTCCCNSNLCNGVPATQQKTLLFTILCAITMLVYHWF